MADFNVIDPGLDLAFQTLQPLVRRPSGLEAALGLAASTPEAAAAKRERERLRTAELAKTELERKKTESEISKNLAEAAKNAGGGIKGLKAAQEIGKRFEGLSSDFFKQKEAQKRIESVAQKPSAVGDLAMIFNFMKLIDPPSVVREGEFRTAAEARAWLGKVDRGEKGEGVQVPNFVRSAIARAQTGQILLPEQRQDFVGQSRNIFRGAQVLHNERRSQFKGLATQFGVSPEAAILGPDEIIDKETLGENPAVKAVIKAIKAGRISREHGKGLIEEIQNAR
ncbi:MAG: hypothetical protein QME66_05825 [Candidatus Eisenbacteria bacterium]|nr:hypothetical protein [Candidatus Eisenbacteria bacterium]